MEALDFETEPPQKVASAWLERLALDLRHSPDAHGNPARTLLRI
jgi:hypothetical protein